MVNVIIDIEGCPSTGQKQVITDQITALFKRICPSLPLRNKQLELIVASIIGAEVNASVRFEVVGYEDAVPPFPRDLVYQDGCGLEPACDVLPCLNEVIFTNPTAEVALLNGCTGPIVPKRYGADGCVPFVEIDDPSCCPPPLCGNDLCCTFVDFIQHVAIGPLWDYWKAAAISYFQQSDDPC